MKNKWNEMTVVDKIMIVIRVIVSIVVVVLASFQLLGIWENAIDFTTPLLGVVVLIQSFQEWKQRRGSAILGISVALFIFVCTIAVWFGK